jgi:hypothetical protein
MDRGSPARRLAARAVYEAGTWIGRYPSVVLPITRWRGHGEPLDRSTALVIEGYPRSGNSLAVAAFARAQPTPTTIAHHVHAPAHVIAAARRGLPALLLIRPPEDAVVELVLIKPDLAVGQALRGWIRFYAPLDPLRSRFVVATADEVAADPGTAVRRLNDRFGTSFAIPENSDAAREAALEDVRVSWGRRAGPGLPLIGRTEVDENAGDRDRLRRAFHAARLSPSRRHAEDLYRSLTRPS